VSPSDPAARVLLVDDDVHTCRLFAAELRARGAEVVWKTSSADALAVLAADEMDVVVADIEMQGMNGLELCQHVVERWPDLPVVIVTAHNDVERAVGAVRAGAFDFIAKPADLDLVGVSIDRAVGHRRLRQEVRRLRRAVADAHGFGSLRYESEIMRNLGRLLSRIAETDASVLITGESGTGKELIARGLHDAGPRRSGPFVALNCAAVPEPLLESELFGHVRGAFTDAHASRHGLFVQAHGGTLFLDEVGDLSPHLQPKLLRALQERTVRPVGGDRTIACDVRIIAATNQHLEAAAIQGHFRQDLYFRLNVIHVEVPPLRARGRDILLLAQAFLEQYAKQVGNPIKAIAPAAAERLLAYRWPGNVRELQNCMERAVTLAARDGIGIDDLPERIRNGELASASGNERSDVPLVPLDEIERRHVLRVLDAVRGNRTNAAEILGLDRKTLYRKLRRYGHTR